MNLLEDIAQYWGWVGIEPEEVVDENDFGNLLIRDCRDRFWRLCPEDVYCEIVAENKAELDALLGDPEFHEDWRMPLLVEQAAAALGPLTEGRKYSLAVPSVLGGEYEVANVKIVPWDELVQFSGDLGRQIKDLPDGTEVQLKVIE